MNPKDAIKLIRRTKGPLYVWVNMAVGCDGYYLQAVKSHVIWELENTAPDAEIAIRVAEGNRCVHIN